MIRVKKIILGISLITPLLMNAQKNNTIKDITKGQRVDTVIQFDEQKAFHYLPLTIIKGNQEGPVFTIIAGIHGYEYPPIVATQELLKELDPMQVKGTIIVIPIANVASFYQRSPFVNPIDGKNLNNAFPGNSNGSLTDQIANWITKNIIPVSDVFLDIHGGDASEDLLPFICYYNNQANTAKTQEAHQLSEASGMGYIVSYPYSLTKNEPAKYAFKQAVQDDITALSIEAGKLGTVQEENVELIKSAVYNMLAHKGVYDKPIKKQSEDYTIVYDQHYIRVPESGFFYSNFNAGDKINKDQEIGYITDDFGRILSRVTSPVNGVILYKVGTPPVNQGETLFCIGH